MQMTDRVSLHADSEWTGVCSTRCTLGQAPPEKQMGSQHLPRERETCPACTLSDACAQRQLGPAGPIYAGRGQQHRPSQRHPPAERLEWSPSHAQIPHSHPYVESFFSSVLCLSNSLIQPSCRREATLEPHVEIALRRQRLEDSPHGRLQAK